MSSEEQAKRFINTLKELGGSAGNGSLSAELGWADSTYQRIKARLIEEGRIVPGRGRGGSVALAEGVSDASRLERVRSFGFDLAQGFHLARPMALGELADFVGSTRDD